jgi:sucrose-6-phosphate hydrolase SacC (GH32 family)
MTWKKKGLIYNVKGNYSWNKSHAQCPVVDVISDSVWRIYYATRNSKGQSQISYIEVEAEKPKNIIYEHNDYLFQLGDTGTFDDSGVMPSSIVNHEGKKYLFYIGWTLKQTVPYHNSIGMAVSEDNGKTFKRRFQGSILPAIHTEPYFTGTSYVIIENGIWRMWYLSCVEWNLIDGKQEPSYHIKYAESKDGVHWKRDGIVAIDFKNNTEGGIVSASVIKEEHIYKMWYAYRKAQDYRANIECSYRIGYAESPDGRSWTRLDENVGINLTSEGWDSKMMSYPNVIKNNEIKYLFYNGNDFGKTGFGYAIMEPKI